MYLKCLFCHSQVAATVPSYKARLRTVLLKAQLQERIAQIKPVISLSFVCFIWSITYLSFTLIRPWQKQWRISPAYERSQFVFCSKLFESKNIHDKKSHFICISASWNSHYRLPRAYGLWKTPKIHRGTLLEVRCAYLSKVFCCTNIWCPFTHIYYSYLFCQR